MLGVYNPENESFDRFEPFDFNKIPLFVFIDASNDMWTICERTIYRYNSFTFDIKDSVNIDFSVITSYLWGIMNYGLPEMIILLFLILVRADILVHLNV